MATLFNFDAALAEAQKQGQLAVDFLKAQRGRLESMAPDAVREVLALFAAGENRKALMAFYGEADWSALEAGAALDVQNGADFATKAKAALELLQTGSVFVAKALLSILVAGFLA